MDFASEHRQALSRALLQVGPGAPTLCEGWTADDLAAHCWVREHRPLSLLGIASPRFAAVTEHEMRRAQARLSFEERATRIATTPVTPLTLTSAADNLVNAAEYFIHTADVVRANGLARRPADDSYEVYLWRRLPLMARMLFRSAPVGVRLEWADSDAAPIRAKAGDATVTIVGRPTEILLFAFGRGAHADVRLIGRDHDVAALRRAPLGA